MFIIRLFKRLLMLIGLGTVVWWGWQYFQADSSMKKKVDDFRQSGAVREGVKDIKTWVSEIYKGAGGQVNNDVTDDEKKQLDEILARELAPKNKNVQGENSKVKGGNPKVGK